MATPITTGELPKPYRQRFDPVIGLHGIVAKALKRDSDGRRRCGEWAGKVYRLLHERHENRLVGDNNPVD